MCAVAGQWGKLIYHPWSRPSSLQAVARVKNDGTEILKVHEHGDPAVYILFKKLFDTSFVICLK